jgi:integrase
MASVRVRPETGTLYLDFRHRGVRCREQTALQDTPANRKAVESLANRIKREQAKGTFSYADFFPDSPRTREFDSAPKAGDANQSIDTSTATPSFAEFAELWFLETEPRWRKQYREQMRATLDRIVLPYFGTTNLHNVDRAMLLAFQAEAAKRKGRGGQSLSAKRINKLMALVKTILNEGCDRYELTSPARGLKRLKQKRSEVHPFTLEEVNRLIAGVREDYRPYLTLRLLTGLRTGEADGLQWEDIDFERDQLHVQRTVSRGGDGDTKTESSKRVVPLVPQVKEALLVQQTLNVEGCPWVFHSAAGNPVDVVNFTNRVWYPLLRHLGLKLRPPYQMRHTAATLMLAAGENPEWVAKVLGHTTTEMLFRVYSRFVPNLTRNDGRAFTGLVSSRVASATPNTLAVAIPDLENLSRNELEALLRKALASQNPKETP